MNHITKDKAEIRRQALSVRDSLDSVSRQAKDRLIADSFLGLPEYQHAEMVLFYVSFSSEVGTIPLIEHAFKQGKQVAVPKVFRETRRLGFYRITSTDELVSGYNGIYEPIANADCEVVDVGTGSIDIIAMPGIAFDASGCRVGYGGGYYDRLLKDISSRTVRIALAYKTQVMEKVPVESHDQRVHKIVTENGVITCQWT